MMGLGNFGAFGVSWVVGAGFWDGFWEYWRVLSVAMLRVGISVVNICIELGHIVWTVPWLLDS